MSKRKYPTVRTALPLQTWRLLNGGNRQAPSADQRGTDPQPGNAGGDDTLDAIAYAFQPGGITRIDPDSPSMIATLANQRVVSTLLYGHGPVLQTWRYFPDLPRRPDLKREMQIGEITGYRAWRLEDGYLRSVYMHDVWKPNQIIEGRELSDWDERGVHAWKEPNSEQFFKCIRRYMRHNVSPLWVYDKNDATPAIVTGSVFLWGDVVEHEFGYRAEFAKVRSLDYLYPAQEQMGQEGRVLHDLRMKYHVV